MGSPGKARVVPVLNTKGGWEELLQGEDKATLEQALPAYLAQCRWFGGKARPVRSSKIFDVVPLPCGPAKAQAAFVQVEYAEGDPEVYVLLLAYASGETAAKLQETLREGPVARLAEDSAGQQGIIYNALEEPSFCAALLGAIGGNQKFKGAGGEIAARATSVFERLRGDPSEALAPSLVRAEQSNSSVVYKDRLILKLFRKLQEGINPDVEILTFLSDKTSFTHAPAVGGSLEYRAGRGEPMALGILQAFVPNQGDAWHHTLKSLEGFFERAAKAPEPRSFAGGPLDWAAAENPAEAAELIGDYLDAARLLGQRTAEMHLALASSQDDENFRPEPYTALDQRAAYQSMQELSAKVFELLRSRLGDLPDEARSEANRLLARQEEIAKRFQALLDRKLTALRTRIHGDYHLGQVLYTGSDFLIIDFEGEPARTLSERRSKRSPLQDVAGMLRSFHYASSTPLYGQPSGAPSPANFARMERWARWWYACVSSAYLKTYLEVAGSAPFLPRAAEERQVLLEAFLLEKAVYELGYELNNRPGWVKIPLQGILQLL